MISVLLHFTWLHISFHITLQKDNFLADKAKSCKPMRLESSKFSSLKFSYLMDSYCRNFSGLKTEIYLTSVDLPSSSSSWPGETLPFSTQTSHATRGACQLLPVRILFSHNKWFALQELDSNLTHVHTSSVLYTSQYQLWKQTNKQTK